MRLAALLLALMIGSVSFCGDGVPNAVKKGKPVPRPVAGPRIELGDCLQIHVTGTRGTPDHAWDIWGLFRVEPGGEVALGPMYGRVLVNGLTLEKAEARVQEHLRKLGSEIVPGTAQVSLTVPGCCECQREGASPQQVRELQEELRTLREEVNRLRTKIAQP